MAASIAVISNVASATPFATPLAIKNAIVTDTKMVWGRGFGVGAGFLGGAIVGGALVAPYATPTPIMDPTTDPIPDTDIRSKVIVIGTGMIGNFVVAINPVREGRRRQPPRIVV